MTHELYERNHFEFLVPHDKRSTDPMAVVDDLRSGVADLPETSATFRLGYVLDDHEPQSVHDKMITLVGAWRVPSIYKDTSDGTATYVNPHYPSRGIYSDVFTECNCGAFMAREERIRGSVVGTSEHDHADDCTRADRLRARADLLDKRAAIIEEMLSMGRPAAEASQRMAMSDRADHSIGPVARDMNLPTQEWKREGKEKRMNTEMILLTMGYTPEEVGVIWDIGGSAVRERIATKTEYDLSELYEFEPPESLRRPLLP